MVREDSRNRSRDSRTLGSGFPRTEISTKPGDKEIDDGLGRTSTLRFQDMVLATRCAEPELPLPRLLAGQPLERGADALGYSVMAGDVVSLWGRSQALGVATKAEIRPDTFEQRLRAEAAAADAVLLSPLMVGAWARVP